MKYFLTYRKKILKLTNIFYIFYKNRLYLFEKIQLCIHNKINYIWHNQY